MSITVEEILKLPSMQGAQIVAGERGLERWVSAVSVLEYTDDIQFKNVYAEYFGNEILISAFYDMRNSVDRQCWIIQQLSRKKVAGIILFYIGFILPKLDERVIEVANRLDFPLIAMPENRPDLLYSEVIYEIMEIIIKSQFIGYDFKNDIIEQVSRLPEHQRSIGTVMRILSDETHASILLADAAGEPLNISVWPRNMSVEHYLQDGKVSLNTSPEKLGGENYQASSCPIRSSRGLPLQAVIYKRGEPLASDVVRQVGEAIQIAMHLWENRRENLLPELVGAILRDEPYKISRISALFGINISSIQDMWVIAPKEGHLDKIVKLLPGLISEELSHQCENVIFDISDGKIVMMIGAAKNNASLADAASSFCSALTELGMDAVLIACRKLSSPAYLRKAYITVKSSLETAMEIYPRKRLFTMSEIKYADRCRKIIESGEMEIGNYTEILEAIPKDDGVPYSEMLKTLSVYYLDACCNAAQAGEILFLHKNTIQYRVRKFKESVAYGMEDLPEVIDLYIALALQRIMEGIKSIEK